MDTNRKAEILNALRNDKHFGLVSVRTDSAEGVLVYEDGVTALSGEPAIEIPHEDPYLTEHPPTSFEKLLSEYGCVTKQRYSNTYVVVDEDVASKRPTGGDDA